MYYEHEYDLLRKQMKQRYSRLYLLKAHVTIVLSLTLVLWLIHGAMALKLLFLLTLIPHSLYVGYKELQLWIDHKVERQLYHVDRNEDGNYYNVEKRKNYPQDDTTYYGYRLTDDGELEPNQPVKAKRGYDDVSYSESYDTKMQRSSNKQYKKRYKKGKKRWKFDTDEFNAKKLIKMLKDVID